MQTPRRVVVTGGASGIGAAIAAQFEQQGDLIAILDRAFEREALGQRSERRWHYDCDLADEAAFVAVLAGLEQQFGGVDVLVSNAGFQHVAPIDSFPSEVFRAMLEVMVVAPFVALRQLLPGMRARGWGRVIHLASINALVGFEGKVGYNTAKHAVLGLTRVAALEAARDGVTVNAICPGYVDTPLVRNQLADLAAARGIPSERALAEVILPLVPQGRLLSVSEVAEAAAYLASEGARGITGQTLVLDGGYTAR
jgi:3-hydroxybutyrate dehydrogenase